MGYIRKISWISLVGGFIPIYIILNASGFFRFFLENDNAYKKMNQIYINHSSILIAIFAINILLFPLAFFSYWLKPKVRRLLMSFSGVISLFCIFNAIYFDSVIVFLPLGGAFCVLASAAASKSKLV